MEAVRKLTVDIMSYLKGDGFKKLENEIDKSKKRFFRNRKPFCFYFSKNGSWDFFHN